MTIHASRQVSLFADEHSRQKMQMHECPHDGIHPRAKPLGSKYVSMFANAQNCAWNAPKLRFTEPA